MPKAHAAHFACTASARGALCGALMLCAGAAPAATEAAHAIAMHGAPAMPDDFPGVPYANPAATKGGPLGQGVLGTLDSHNALIVKSLAAQGTRRYVIESLMARGDKEPFTLFVLLARTLLTDDARA